MSDKQLVLSPLDVLQTDNVKLVRNGLELNRQTSYEEWEIAGVALKFLETTIQFALGDWLNFGEHAYGEKYAQFADPEKDAAFYGRLRNYAYVAGNVHLSRRNGALTYSHHYEVAKLDAAEQTHFLDMAEDNDWTVRALRESIRNTNNNHNTAAGRICPTCRRPWNGE